MSSSNISILDESNIYRLVQKYNFVRLSDCRHWSSVIEFSQCNVIMQILIQLPCFHSDRVGDGPGQLANLPIVLFRTGKIKQFGR